jgi:hypothetical protein
MDSITTGYNNTAIGYRALKSNIGGANNIAVGYCTLILNCYGSNNIALGSNALRDNTCSHNIALGFTALRANTTGGYNTAIGTEALLSNTTGYDNTAIGFRALRRNDTGYSNVAIGIRALRNARYNPGSGRNPAHNIAIGSFASYTLYSANSNVAIGFRANYANQVGSGNVAIGVQSLRYTTAQQQTAVGTQALYGATTGAKNVAIGWRANFAITTAQQTIAVGYYAATTNNDFHTVWGNANNSVYNCVWVAWTNVSDCRDKANIQPLSRNLGLPFIKKLNPVSFNWDQRQRYVDVCDFEYGEKDGTLIGERKEYGIIAQDVRKALDELEEQFDGLKYNAELDAYRFTYEALIAPLIKSVQELSERLEAVEEKLK